MEVVVISILLFSSIGLFVYRFATQRLIVDVHLPAEIKGEPRSPFKAILSVPVRFIDQIVNKANLPIDGLRRKLVSAGNPMAASQFFALKLLLMVSLPFAIFILLHSQTPILILAVCVGFFLPEFWLKSKINKRHTAILRTLPHIIDLLNICVGAGLDFMVAVNRVIQEFHPCELINELKILVQEIQMGSSRRDALKKMSLRINSPEVTSFVRTLVQADRMGTPIGEVLKIQAEEIRIRRFQKGEEMALKAPIKLLFPLLVFILPVVLIIVAGPILIQFTRGGMIKF